MGLGWNDGFAPMQDPLYHYSYEFWQKQNLLDEALEIKKKSFVFSDPNSDSVIRAYPLNENTPELNNFYKNFLDHFDDDWGEVSVSYMFINANESYPWHTDEPITKVTGNNTKGVLCAFNVLLLGEDNKVEFKDVGELEYYSAFFNTSHLHRITPKSDRILCRIAFRDFTYDEVISKILKTLNRKPPGEKDDR